MGGGEVLERGEDGRAGLTEALERMMACGDERAGDAEFAGDVVVVEGVADEENLGGWDTEAGDQIAAEREFAVGVNVIESGDVVEVGGETEVRDDLVERLVAVGGENGLAQAGGADGGECRGGMQVQRRLGAARVVAGDEFGAQFLEGINGGIEAEAFVVSTDGKIEERVVARAVEERKLAAREEGVHHADGVVEIVEERAVPVPDNVAVARDGPGGVAACRRTHDESHNLASG